MIKEFYEFPRFENFIGKKFAFFSPNTWTTISLILAVAAFASVVISFVNLGLLLFIASSLCDYIDGKVARATNRSTKLGAFWDGTVDRFVDMLLILCFFFVRLPINDHFIALFLFILLFLTILPPFIVAYANHRGAVPDPTEKVIWRFAFRIEYLIIYFLALFVNAYYPMASFYILCAGFVLMLATVIQSIVLVFIKSRLYL